MSAQGPGALAHTSTPTMLRMGLAPISDAEWLLPFSTQDYQAFAGHKSTMLDNDNNAILVAGSALPALQELHHALAGYLIRYHASEVDDNSISLQLADDTDPFALMRQMSFWVPDDICVLQQAADAKGDNIYPADDYVLTAASVLSPSHWRPVEKFGRTLARIHHPIPGFTEQLTPSVSRFFKRISPGRPFVRFNWGIQPGDGLNWQAATEPPITGETLLYYRSERQCLLRLPASKAVIFFIRINLCELAKLNSHYENSSALAGLLAHIQDLPAAERAYKGLDRLQNALEKYQ